MRLTKTPAIAARSAADPWKVGTEHPGSARTSSDDAGGSQNTRNALTFSERRVPPADPSAGAGLRCKDDLEDHHAEILWSQRSWLFDRSRFRPQAELHDDPNDLVGSRL